MSLITVSAIVWYWKHRMLNQRWFVKNCDGESHNIQIKTYCSIKKYIQTSNHVLAAWVEISEHFHADGIDFIMLCCALLDIDEIVLDQTFRTVEQIRWIRLFLILIYVLICKKIFCKYTHRINSMKYGVEVRLFDMKMESGFGAMKPLLSANIFMAYH